MPDTRAASSIRASIRRTRVPLYVGTSRCWEADICNNRPRRTISEHFLLTISQEAAEHWVLQGAVTTPPLYNVVVKCATRCHKTPVLLLTNACRYLPPLSLSPRSTVVTSHTAPTPAMFVSNATWPPFYRLHACLNAKLTTHCYTSKYYRYSRHKEEDRLLIFRQGKMPSTIIWIIWYAALYLMMIERTLMPYSVTATKATRCASWAPLLPTIPKTVDCWCIDCCWRWWFFYVSLGDISVPVKCIRWAAVVKCAPSLFE